jgi:hypothetical protein
MAERGIDNHRPGNIPKYVGRAPGVRSGQSPLRFRGGPSGTERAYRFASRYDAHLRFCNSADYFAGGAPLSPPWVLQIKFFESVARSQIWFFSTAPSEYAFPFRQQNALGSGDACA